MKKRNATFRPQVETLESRLVPAGSFTADVLGDTLYVTGDQMDNNVYVGFDWGGYTVAEYDTGYYRLFNMGGIANVVISTGEGSDLLEVRLRNFPPNGEVNLTIMTGDGRDSILIHTDGDFGSDAHIGNMTIDTGAGNDQVEMVSWDWQRMAIAGILNISTGDGRDNVYLSDVHVAGNTAIDLGTGNDSFSAGGDIWGSSFVGGLTLDGGHGGQDLLEISAAIFAEFEDSISEFENLYL